MSRGIFVFFIQNVSRSGALKTKIMPSLSPSRSRYISPVSRVAGVSAISTLMSARRWPSGATIWTCGSREQAANKTAAIAKVRISDERIDRSRIFRFIGVRVSAPFRFPAKSLPVRNPQFPETRNT
jgi:hypothetical protein